MEETTILTFDKYCVSRAREIEEDLKNSENQTILEISLNKYRNYLKIIGFKNIAKTFIFENEKMSFFTFLSQVTDSKFVTYNIKILNHLNNFITNFFNKYYDKLYYLEDKEDITITKEDIEILLNK